MTEPAWKELARVKVTAKPEGLWNIVLPYVCGQRLLKVTVQEKDDKGATVTRKWAPSPKKECGPDGLAMTKSGALLATAPYGALVGKVGGGTADLPDSQGSSGPYTGKKVFAAGGYSVVSLGATDCGPFFLTMNDSLDGFDDHSGSLWVLIEEAPI